ncbi:MAG: hypothetical protein ABI442_15880 [Gemmatimonadaceae bacterium]
MIPPIAGIGPATEALDVRHRWLTPERLARVRAILLGITLLVGLAVYVFHTLGTSIGMSAAAHPLFIRKLRGVGVMTWLYALVQMIDMRFYNSRWAQRRRVASGLPDILYGWLFGQMVAWFGILYYGFTEDVRWYVAGLLILGLSFLVFPIRTPS